MEIKWDKRALLAAMGQDEGVRGKVAEITKDTEAAANAMSASFRTEKYYDKNHKLDPTKGETKPNYESDVEMHGSIPQPIGLVYTGNYSAMKDNMLHNTLLKSIRKR